MSSESPDDACATLSEALAAGCDARTLAERARARGEDRAMQDDALVRAAEELHRRALNDPRRAANDAATLAAAARELNAAKGTVAALLAHGVAQMYATELAGAASSFDAADAEVAAHPGTDFDVLPGRVGMGRMHALARQGKLDDAAVVGERSLAIFEARGARPLVARARANLGVIERMRRQPERAIEHIRAALEAWGDDPVGRAQLMSNLAEALLDLQRFREAESAFREARQGLNATDAHVAKSIVDGNLADLLARQGRLAEAIELFEEVRQRHLSIRAEGDAARLQAEEADALAQSGLLRESLVEYREALEALERAGLTLEALRARFGLARALGRLQRFDDAHALLADSALAAGDTSAEGTLCAIRGELSIARGDLVAARQDLERAVSLLAARPVEAAVARLRLADALIALGDVAGASDAATPVLAIAETHLVRPLEADALHVAAKIELARGKSDDARSLLRASLDRVERVRGTFRSGGARVAYGAANVGAAADLTRELVRDGSPAALRESLVVSERVRSRGLFEAILGSVPAEALLDLSEGAAADLSREAIALRHEANVLLSELDRQPAIATSDAWRSAMVAIEDRQRLLSVRADARWRAGSPLAPPVGPEVVDLLVSQPVPIVVFHVAGARLLAVASRGGEVRGADLGDVDDVTESTEQVRFHLQRGLMATGTRAARIERDVESSLAALADTLLAPIADLLDGAGAVQFVPAGPLHALPMHLLAPQTAATRREPIGLAADVATAPSLAVVHALGHAGSANSSGRRVLVGVADANAPAIAGEIDAIAAMDRGACILCRERASMDTVRREAANAAILHMATHGRFLHDSPLRSGIRLADGWLTVTDLHAWRIPGTIVVVSGCDTGRVAVGGGDELVGLEQGFFVAGAKALVMSAWPTHDEATADLMSAMHAELDARASSRADGARWSGRDVAAALRTAMRATRERRPHASQWGAFGTVASVVAR
ncbi:MAG: CHAT domain-containing protein [Phycisphaerae bacterium]|nr:CHAT domain-containing protein [Phycisphaerae bacterium]